MQQCLLSLLVTIASIHAAEKPPNDRAPGWPTHQFLSSSPQSFGIDVDSTSSLGQAVRNKFVLPPDLETHSQLKSADATNSVRLRIRIQIRDHHGQIPA